MGSSYREGRAIGGRTDVCFAVSALLSREEIQDFTTLLTDKRSANRYLLRRVVVLVDNSSGVYEERDLPPNRLVVFGRALQQFTTDFFTMNPTSELAVVGMSGRSATIISPMGAGSATHAERIADKFTSDGDLSFQRGLARAGQVLAAAPAHSTREVLALLSSRVTRDTDLDGGVAAAVAQGLTVHTIVAGCDVHAYRAAAVSTGGSCSVVRTEQELTSCLASHCVPRAAPETQPASFVRMGFPCVLTHLGASVPCVCHGVPHTTTYQCPRCAGRYCTIPTTCLDCGLQLVSSTHATRTAANLRPEPITTDVAAGAGARCVACMVRLTEGSPMAQCGACGAGLCPSCRDLAARDLRTCLGCLLKVKGAAVAAVVQRVAGPVAVERVAQKTVRPAQKTVRAVKVLRRKPVKKKTPGAAKKAALFD